MENFFIKLFDFFKKEKDENSTSKIHLTAGASLILSAETEKNKKSVNIQVKKIAAEFYKHPENILEFAKQSGTKFYKIKNAKKILNFINQTPGLILPRKGLDALYLNFFTSKKISFKSELMFIFDCKNLSMYKILYNFYKWYSYKAGLNGFNEKSVRMLNNLEMYINPAYLNKLNIEEITALKEAIARDREAAEFTLDFMKEIEGRNNAFNTIKNNGSANI